MSYQPGIPTGTVPLNEDYLNLQNNFTQINTQFEVDHVPLTSTSGTPPNGYHKALHLVPVSTVASNAPKNQPINGYTSTGGYGQVLSAQINDDIATDEALYFLSGGGLLTQMTRNFQPTIGTEGATMLPGGLILNWGVATSTGATTFVNLTQKLPGNFFNAQATFQNGSAANRSICCQTAAGPAPAMGFITQLAFLSSSSSKFFWWAIGN